MGIDEREKRFAIPLFANIIRLPKIQKKEDILAHVTERYGTISGATKEALFKSLSEGTPVPLLVGNRNEPVQATVVSLKCSTNARRIFEVEFEGNFWQGKRRTVTVANYDTEASAGGEGVCEYVKREHAY